MDVEFLPPMQFRDLEFPSSGPVGSGAILSNLDQEDDYHPFKVYVLERAPSPGGRANGEAGIEYKSTVWKDENLFTQQTISGLLTDRLDFNDAGWETFPAGEKIVYLKGTVSGGQVTAINVDWDVDFSQLNTKKRLIGGTPCTVDNQTEFFCPIAKVFRYNTKPEKLGVDQYVFTHLLLKKVKFGDDEGWYPCPGPGGGGSEEFPWDIKLAGKGTPAADGTYSSYGAIVVPGIAGGILASNWDTEFSVSNTLTYGVVKCTTDGGNVTSTTISFESSYPSPPDEEADQAPASVEVAFGMIKDGRAYNFIKGFLPLSTNPTRSEYSGDDLKFYYTWKIG